MSNKVPYVIYGIILAIYTAQTYTNRAAYAVFSTEDETCNAQTSAHNPCSIFSTKKVPCPTACIPFSQLAPITYENRPSLQSFIEEIRRSKDLEQKELSFALPQISLFGLAGKTDYQKAVELPLPSRQTTLKINQLLWSFAGPIQKYHIQKSNTAVNEKAEQFHRTTIRLESELSFLDALLNVRNKDRIQALDASSHSVFEQAITNNRVGFLSDPAWKQTESDFATSQTAVMRYQDDLKNSFSFLERALSIPLMIESNNQTPCLMMEHGLLAFKVAPLDTYLESALLLRPDLSGKAWEVDLAEKTSSFLMNSYAPEIDFSFNLSRFNFRTRDLGVLKQITFQLALSVSWKFDSFANAHEAQAYEAETVSLKMQQLDLSLAIQRDVKSAYYSLEALLKEVEAEKARYITAEAQFESQKHQYEIGQISEVDFTVAQTNWQIAQYTLDQSKITAEKKYRELLFACGYPPEFDQAQNLWSHK